MKVTEPIRLALIGIFALLLQLTIMLSYPEWRVGFDLYLVYILILTTTRGPAMGGTYAMLGGLFLDAFSGQHLVFHLLFYLLPVGIGSLVRSHMLIEFKSLGTLTVGGLLLFKVVAELVGAMLLGHIDSAFYIFRVNYLSILLFCGLVYLFWPALVNLMPPAQGGRRVGY
ncbi:hypothetical protein KDL29_08090 [bacterium]|nr:hypothetical protein [bacterium]MCB1220387.1 hypothetical protein [bacterium]UNM08356.1 MAG: hypothetical protein H7A35_16125 [Planctomycetales bacterium]